MQIAHNYNVSVHIWMHSHEPFSRDKILDDSNGIGFRDILLSTIATAAIAKIELYHRKYTFF